MCLPLDFPKEVGLFVVTGSPTVGLIFRHDTSPFVFESANPPRMAMSKHGFKGISILPRDAKPEAAENAPLTLATAHATKPSQRGGLDWPAKGEEGLG